MRICIYSSLKQIWCWLTGEWWLLSMVVKHCPPSSCLTIWEHWSERYVDGPFMSSARPCKNSLLIAFVSVDWSTICLLWTNWHSSIQIYSTGYGSIGVGVRVPECLYVHHQQFPPVCIHSDTSVKHTVMSAASVSVDDIESHVSIISASIWMLCRTPVCPNWTALTAWQTQCPAD